MNSFAELNAVGASVIEVDDTRPATVIFDKDTRYFDPDQLVTYTSNVITFVPSINIEEVINYSTANARFRVEIITSGATPGTITFATMPTGLTLTQAGSVYTITGIKDSVQWDTISTFTWTMPAGYASERLFFLKLSILYYDQSTSSEKVLDWIYYDDAFYYLSYMESRFNFTSTMNKIIRSSSSLVSLVSATADPRKIVASPSTAMISLASLQSKAAPKFNYVSVFAPITIDGGPKLLTLQTVSLPSWNAPTLSENVNFELVKWTTNGNSVVIQEYRPTNFVSNSSNWTKVRKYNYNSTKTTLIDTNINYYARADLRDAISISTNSDGTVIQQLDIQNSTINFYKNNIAFEVVASGSNYFDDVSVSSTSDGYNTDPSSSRSSQGMSSDARYRFLFGQEYTGGPINLILKDNNQTTGTGGSIQDKIVKSISVSADGNYDAVDQKAAVQWNTSLNGYVFAGLTSRTNLFISTNLDGLNTWPTTYDQNITVTTSDCMAMDSSANYIVVGKGYLGASCSIQIFKRNVTSFNSLTSITLPNYQSGNYIIRVMVSQNASVIAVLERTSTTGRIVHVYTNTNDVFTLAKSWVVGEFNELAFNYNQFDMSNDGKYFASVYGTTLKIQKII